MRSVLAGGLAVIVLLGIGLGAASAAYAVTEARAWEETLDRVASAVVVLRVASPRAFDDGTAGTSTATGFVVDAEQGLILTNRHVVTPGPVVAEAVFLNNEEVDVQAVYRDPVHDFGLFRCRCTSGWSLLLRHLQNLHHFFRRFFCGFFL